MHRFPRPLSRHLAGLLLAGAACAPLAAAELGDIRVGSHIGQPLVADIELALVDDAGQPVQVRLADPEVYHGAGIAMPPVLATLHLSVMRRDGRQYLHVTSVRPVDADHLHLYLALTDQGQQGVRLATLWLTPDPNPAPPAPAAPATPATPPVLAPVQAPAAAMREVIPVAAPAAPVAGAPRRVPAAPRIAPAAAVPLQPARPHPVEAPACARPAQEAQACVALGVKNAELRAHLGSLEEKVKGLQASLGAAPPHEEAREPAGPKPIQSIKPLVPRKPKEPVPEEGPPWGILGAVAGVLAAAGGAVAVLRRRRSRGAAAPAAAAPVAEPSLE